MYSCYFQLLFQLAKGCRRVEAHNLFHFFVFQLAMNYGLLMIGRQTISRHFQLAFQPSAMSFVAILSINMSLGPPIFQQSTILTNYVQHQHICTVENHYRSHKLSDIMAL